MIWWRELDEPEIPDAIATVQRWGYPRAVEETHAIWARLGEHAFAWFEAAGEGAWLLHLCLAPSSRGRLGLRARAAIAGLLHIAAFLGARRLLATVPFQSRTGEYVERLGFAWDRELGAWVKELRDG